MSFGSKICKYQEDILRDLSNLVAIPSVRGEAREQMPYGEKPAEALRYILSLAKKMGLETKNIDGYAGHAEYGQGKEVAAVLAHVDVVPAGNGWHTDPFSMTIRDGLAYGRGTADDKGAAIVALYCLKVLQEEHIPAKRRLRAIFGAGEETGMDDLEYYFKKEPLPVIAFTPDAEYGICNREKGILHLELFKDQNDSAVVKEFHAGMVVNAVPDRACAKIVCTQQQFDSLSAKSQGKQCTVERTEDGASILFLGRAAHAMQPQVGQNAAALLIRLLTSVFEKAALGDFLTFLDQKIGLETDGASMGVKTEDEPSGELTFNLGLLNITGERACAGIDIRYPVTAAGDQTIAILQEQSQAAGLGLKITAHNPPLYLPEDSQLISILKNSFQEVTGKTAELYATGGGTYARSTLGSGVAFGPFFPDEPDRKLHDADENIEIDRFMVHAQICLESMYRMLTV